MINKFIFLFGTDVSARGHFIWEKAAVPERTYLSKQATNIPYHIQPLYITGIEPGSQR